MQLAVRDAAGILNVSEKTIYRWIKEGRLPAYRVSDQYRFNRAELLEWATARRINVSPAIFQEPEGSHVAVPTLGEALQAGGIHYRIGGTDKQAVLRSVVDVMRLPDSVDREFLLQVLLARELLGSTGIGDGTAIPHVRNPIVLHIPTVSVTLCFLEHPIDFNALDGKPVNTLFTIISPTIRAHLHVLSKLAFVLRDAAFKAILTRQGSRDEILDAVRYAEAKLATADTGRG
jgi:nitrogen PTS system EIIA component